MSRQIADQQVPVHTLALCFGNHRFGNIDTVDHAKAPRKQGRGNQAGATTDVDDRSFSVTLTISKPSPNFAKGDGPRI